MVPPGQRKRSGSTPTGGTRAVAGPRAASPPGARLKQHNHCIKSGITAVVKRTLTSQFSRKMGRKPVEDQVDKLRVYTGTPSQRRTKSTHIPHFMSPSRALFYYILYKIY